MSKPRAATSVATKIGDRPDLNWLRTFSLSFWDLSPWMAAAPNCLLSVLDSWSHILLVVQNISILEPESWDRNICSRRRSFSEGVTTSTCWQSNRSRTQEQKTEQNRKLKEMYLVKGKKEDISKYHQCSVQSKSRTWVIALLATSSSTLPMVTWTGWTRSSSAILRTSLGQVAVYIRVCRPEGMSLTIFRICGSNPISSMRSASSRTRYETCFRLIFRISRMSFNLPGVATTTSTPLSKSLNWGPLGAPP